MILDLLAFDISKRNGGFGERQLARTWPMHVREGEGCEGGSSLVWGCSDDGIREEHTSVKKQQTKRRSGLKWLRRGLRRRLHSSAGSPCLGKPAACIAVLLQCYSCCEPATCSRATLSDCPFQARLQRVRTRKRGYAQLIGQLGHLAKTVTVERALEVLRT